MSSVKEMRKLIKAIDKAIENGVDHKELLNKAIRLDIRIKTSIIIKSVLETDIDKLLEGYRT